MMLGKYPNINIVVALSTRIAIPVAVSKTVRQRRRWGMARSTGERERRRGRRRRRAGTKYEGTKELIYIPEYQVPTGDLADLAQNKNNNSNCGRFADPSSLVTICHGVTVTYG